MKILRPFCVIICLAAAITLSAQAQTLTAEETERLIESAHKIFGPKAGSLLYQENAVLTISNRQPACEFDGDYLIGDVDMWLQLNELANKHGITFFLEDGSLEIASTPAIKTFLAGAEVDWYGPFEENADPIDWINEQTTFIYDKLGGFSPELDSHASLGVPQVVLSADEENHWRGQSAKQIVSVTLHKPQRFQGPIASVEVLAKDVESDELQTWIKSRRDFLDEFYELEGVQKRIHSPSFLTARTQVTDYVSYDYSECWWRDELEEDQTSLSLLSYNSLDLESWQEQLLNEKYSHWSELIEANTPPSHWIRKFNEWSYQQGYNQAVKGEVLEEWLWLGAYEDTPARTAVYRAFKKQRPGYYKERAAKVFQEWDEASEYSKFLPRDILPALSHPEVKAHFRQLPKDVQEKHRADLQTALEEAKNKALLNAEPYSVY